jgi:hypothetical protein
MLRWFTLLVCGGVGGAALLQGLPTLPSMARVPLTASTPSEEEVAVSQEITPPPGPSEVAAPSPLLSRLQAANRIQEVLVAAGCPLLSAESILEVMTLETGNYRSPRLWFLNREPRVRIDADTGALLCMDLLSIKTPSHWPALPHEGADYALPDRPRITAADAKSIVDAWATEQYTAFAGRVFELIRIRPLARWPVWDVNYRERVAPDDPRYANEVSGLVDWATGRVLKFDATNVHAPYRLEITEAAATEIALKDWAKRKSTGSWSGTRARLDVYSCEDGALPMWNVTVASVGAQGAESHRVHIHGVSGEIQGWGGSD